MVRYTIILLLAVFLCLALVPPVAATSTKHRRRNYFRRFRRRTCCKGCPNRKPAKCPVCRICPNPTCPGADFEPCGIDIATIPFDKRIIGIKFNDTNDCDPDMVTQTTTFEATANRISYMIKNKDSPCPFGFAIEFTTRPEETVGFEILSFDGLNCEDAPVNRVTVADRAIDDPLTPDICITLLDLHRNALVLSERDKRCGTNTGNNRITSALSFLEVLAYQLKTTLDFVGFVSDEPGSRPDQRL